MKLDTISMKNNNNPNFNEKTVIDAFGKLGLIICDEVYYNAKTKISCVDNIGYKYYATYDSVRVSNRKPTIVSPKNIYSIENIILWLSINKPQYKLLSKTYKNSHELLNFKCEKHGEFKMCWGNMAQGQNCPECAKITLKEKQKRLTIEEVKSRVTDKIKTIQVISNEWTSTKFKIKCMCSICNTEFLGWYTNLMKGEGCPVCGIRRGENSGQWKGGITPLHNHLRKYILQWKIDSFKLYDYKCCITGDGENIVIHHKHGFSRILQETVTFLNLPIHNEINKYSKEELESIENKCLELHYKYGLGVCISERIHKLFHSIYGTSNNTTEQWNEFYKNYNSKEN